MSVTYVCDYCGLPIEDDDMATYTRKGRLFDADGEEIWTPLFGEEIGHYHSYSHDGQPSCQRRIHDAIEAAEQAGRKAGAIPTLEAIPTLGETTSPQRRSRGRFHRATSRARTPNGGVVDTRHAEYTRCGQEWREKPWEDREALLLDALGDQCLTTSEIAMRMSAALGWSEKNSPIYREDARAVAMRLLASGQLERIPEMYRNKPRYRWQRKRGPSIDEAVA